MEMGFVVDNAQSSDPLNIVLARLSHHRCLLNGQSHVKPCGEGHDA